MRTGWDNLRQTLTSVLGLGLSGFASAGPDVGGFSGEPPSTELFIRWFQLASFLPFFRTHSTLYMPPSEPWEFGAEAEAALSKALRLRYRLLPYWYTLAWQARRTGAPPVRPLCWADPGSAELHAADDTFLLGDANRGGSQDPGRGSDRALELILFRPAQAAEDAGGTGGEGLLYSDAGDGFCPYRLDRFELKKESGSWRLSWSSEGEYPWPYDEVGLILHGFPSPRVCADGVPVPVREGRFPLPAPAEVSIQENA